MSNTTNSSKVELTTEYKRFLERLRRSGSTNMFGAAPYLQVAFDLSITDARQLLSEWMKTYDPEDKDYVDL